MTSRRYGILFPLVALVACAGGTTMRVAKDDGSGDNPVALAPTPETATDQATSDTVTTRDTVTTSDTATNRPSRETDSLSTGATGEKGYAAYANGGGLELRRIGQWTRTGVGEARRLVIRDANAWANFWSELGVGDRPAVDFTRDIVLAVTAGQRPTGGYEIAVDRVRQANGELTVEVVETTPGPNCITTASLTQPVDIIVVPAVTARSWSFIERKEVRGCL
jgi:PrcB C-terminal